ncbi:SDR family NAD(P)-dependent oxidoreductase [Natronococcus jeotgali]|uniref:Short-chain dehydrogenase/reductase SDR n=1 Tax=Natronococcus jeotgali DSM 18795 TaxID=1227498 RepID=L9X7S1_9EURY|nr:glucose 1-dehydrogenase [Natronococcus jeotgali]ELY57780.1 short-chain dehydrogenase/reductase SDR [Natronococcus jeotgali DSM 18795]
MSTDQFGVDGDVAIVTGASSGIGAAIAKGFADDGVDVVICSREQDNVDPVAEEIEESDRPGEALPVECDVTDREAVDAMVEATVEEFGGLDVLVNNAGASFMANFDDISENGWKTIVDINAHGTYHCTQAAAKHLKAGGGIVINLASVAGQTGSPYMSHYGAAKAAVVNLTTTLSYEWASEGVRVNCIAPGFVATEGVESQMGISADEVDRTEVERRMGTVDEIADLAQFLASPASSYVVGETITAQGVPRIEESPDV